MISELYIARATRSRPRRRNWHSFLRYVGQNRFCDLSWHYNACKQAKLQDLTFLKMTPRETRLHELLTQALEPEQLEIRDDSSKHAGHAGARPEGQTHYHITIVSCKFAGLSRVDRHRMVMGLLKEEFSGGLHALVLDLRHP